MDYTYSDSYLGQPRAIKVVVVGAGISGIAAVKMFRDQFKDRPVELVVYEKNHDVGGTWLENRYPGCSCDVPAHAYSYSWEGNPNWSAAYVGSMELFNFFKGRAKAYGVYDHLHLAHKIEKAVWDGDAGKWTISIRDLEKNTSFVTKAEVLINAAGFLNGWKWPEIEGLKEFGGHLVHSARWDESYDFTGKTVAVIGSGSSAIQIVPELQPVVSRLISFNRSPTWITTEILEQWAPQGRQTKFSADEKARWSTSPDIYLQYRKAVEGDMNKFFDLQYKQTDLQKEQFEKSTLSMMKKLAAKPELVKHLVPEFAVGCRRLTPGYRYLESLVEENVDVESEEISRVFEKGLETRRGKIYEVDAIICATGFDTSYQPNFPVIGIDGKDLRDVWQENPKSYLSVAATGFPNYFIIGGPNFPLANGTLIPCLEKCIEYTLKAVEKLQSQGVKSMHPKTDAVEEFQQHKDSVMRDLVWTSGCRSWYKNGEVDGKVWGPWCGSSLHFLELMSDPRWEDWNIEHTTENRFQFLGNGKCRREVCGGDLTYYMTQQGG